MKSKECLLLIAEDVLQLFGYTQISVLGIKYDVMDKVHQEAEKLSEYKTLEAVEKIGERIDAFRKARATGRPT